MKINIHNHTIVKLHITNNDTEELYQIEELYFEVLSKVFLNKPALIVTIKPQKKSSIGYEIGSFQEMKIERFSFLINTIKSCSSSILMEISRSEEFIRGLLLLIVNTKELEENIEKVLRNIGNNIGVENLLCETVVCENDGNSLCLYNTTVDSEQLIAISKKITANVVSVTL